MEQNTPPATQQQVTERLKAANNILVTVTSSPSVDQLAATLGITLVLNKIGKHATAVFSGKVPSTIDFLKPEATLEKNTDSLRDFIVSLDKSKADKLRYKVEENVVKIFITPYRTSLSEKDLEFSQGDFNVDVVLALGVSEQGQLDQAITAHGRILHDATVITVSAGGTTSSLGALNWQDSTTSSLSEMLATVSEGLGEGVFDAQIATALLTGIVAETDRFSNDKTNPKVMALASRLMAAGANQQLIAAELEEPELQEDKTVAIDQKDKSMTIKHGEEEKPKQESAAIPDSKPAELPEPVEEVSKAEPAEEKFEEPILEVPKTATAEVEEKPESHKESPIEPITLDSLKAAPVTQAPEEEHEIEIDEHGTLTIARQRPSGRMVDQAAPSMQPSSGFSANMYAQDESNATNADPLTTTSADKASPVPFQTSTSQPLMTHSAFVPAPSVTPPVTNDTTSSPSSAQPPSDTAPTAGVTPTTPEPVTPEIPSAPVFDVDSARNAVNNAITAAPYDPGRPEPLQALNAAPINLETPAADASTPPLPTPQDVPAVNDIDDLPEAPPVPPPMLPMSPK